MICKDGVKIAKGEPCPACGAQSWGQCGRREYAIAAAQADPSKRRATAYDRRDHRDE
jgi:hypothetical protein